MCAAIDSMAGGACGLAVARKCVEALEGETAVPAAVVLHTLLTQLWRKQAGGWMGAREQAASPVARTGCCACHFGVPLSMPA